MADDAEGFLVARITIERRATEDDVIDSVTAEDSNGDELPISESLGMLRLAEHTILTPDPDDDR